jgi:glycolate oxidase iron-sulfur subunit
MTACPSGVDYSKLIEATRGQIERNHTRSMSEKVVRQLVFATFPRPDRLRWLRWPLLAYQKSGAAGLLRRSGLIGRLPAPLRAMESLMPPLTRRERLPARTPATGAVRKRVGLLLGCVQREFLSRVNSASARVLAAEGYEVIAPSEQPCCGALLMHAGEEAKAVVLAKRMIDVFEQQRVDLIAINAGGCGSHMKEYGHLLRDDAAYADRARRFSAQCRDISEVLTEAGGRATRHPLAQRVAYHDSCHLQHAQRVRSAPRTLLSQIPGLDLVELPEGPICCGSAGIYNIVQPGTAAELGDRKAGLIAPLDVDLVATGNPGCILQLQSALARAGSRARVVHTVEVLDASIRGGRP